VIQSLINVIRALESGGSPSGIWDPHGGVDSEIFWNRRLCEAFPGTTRVSSVDPHPGPEAFTPTSARYAFDCELKSWKEASPPGPWQELHVGCRIVLYTSVNVAGAAAESPLSALISGAELEPLLQDGRAHAKKDTTPHPRTFAIGDTSVDGKAVLEGLTKSSVKSLRRGRRQGCAGHSGRRRITSRK
jgi:hypothetical protein